MFSERGIKLHKQADDAGQEFFGTDSDFFWKHTTRRDALRRLELEQNNLAVMPGNAPLQRNVLMVKQVLQEKFGITPEMARCLIQRSNDRENEKEE